MKIKEAKKRLENVKSLEDFQELFYIEVDGTDVPLFDDIVYKTISGYSKNLTAKRFDTKGSCCNSYMQFEDGYLPCPF